MPLTGISNRGLVLIGMLVALLWGCILTERIVVRRAIEQTEHWLGSHPRGPASTPVKRRRINELRAAPALASVSELAAKG